MVLNIHISFFLLSDRTSLLFQFLFTLFFTVSFNFIFQLQGSQIPDYSVEYTEIIIRVSNTTSSRKRHPSFS